MSTTPATPPASSEPADGCTASIVVPSYRGAARLPQLLDSLARQTPGTPPFEVIVVVDGIDDGSVEIVEREDRLDARVILFPANRGRVAALNAGFDAAQGEILIRCDDDLLPGPDYVVAHIDAHENGSRGVVGLYLNQYEPTAFAEAYGRSADTAFRRAAYQAPPDMTWRYWAGNCSVPRQVWETVGAYDPDYRLYGWEDVDYGFRIAAAGFPVDLVRRLETGHRVAAVTTEIRARRAAHSSAARRIFERKHGTDVLPSAVPSWSAWNLGVRAVSHLTTIIAPHRVGAAIDKLLPHVPRSIGHKLVALAVEGSALSGYRHPNRATEVF